MNNKNIKVVDEHSIDRDANIIFALDLDGSEYVVYWIKRDEDNGNIFVSKVIKNLDGTFNMLNIDDSMEKAKLSDIVKELITTSVNSSDDRLTGTSLTLSDGKDVKFITVLFNKEQNINVQKTYITTVKMEVIRVAEKYFDVKSISEETKIFEDIFPAMDSISDRSENNVSNINVFSPVTDNLNEKLNVISNESTINDTVVSKPDNFVTFGSETTVPKETIETPSVLVGGPENVSLSSDNSATLSNTSVSNPSIIEPITVGGVVSNAETAPLNVLPNTIPSANNYNSSAPIGNMEQTNTVAPSLVIDASKETNLNAALGEAASSTSIPVENIESVREFGVDSISNTQTPQVNVAPQNVNQTVSPVVSKAGFANSKFFMVVAVAFFLASCIFLGYEVFNYFQLTK